MPQESSVRQSTTASACSPPASPLLSFILIHEFWLMLLNVLNIRAAWFKPFAACKVNLLTFMWSFQVNYSFSYQCFCILAFHHSSFFSSFLSAESGTSNRDKLKLKSTVCWPQREHLRILVDYAESTSCNPSLCWRSSDVSSFFFVLLYSYSQKHVNRNDFIATDRRQKRRKVT